MVEILQNKNLATRFQILVEIAQGGPNIPQQDIARMVNITPQAVSDYIRQLINDGLVYSDGRSRYRVTSEGVNWIIKELRELKSYHAIVEKTITNISVCAAVADTELAKGQTVGLKMKEGILFATERTNGAHGIVFSGAKAGEDVGISGIEGIVRLETGKVTILKVPGIEKGGSRTVDTEKLKSETHNQRPVGAIGIEAIVALKRTHKWFIYKYGVTEAAIEAAYSGLSFLVVCVDSMTSDLIKRLDESGVSYELIDMRKEMGSET
jgi:putative transcriptional regulator